MQTQLNVYGKLLKPCSFNPLTGWYRSGYCETDEHDYGTHVVCAKVTDKFLQFTKSRGNNLIDTVGLKDGDFWCLCALRWLEAYRYDKNIAPKIDLERTNIMVLHYVSIKVLEKYRL
jgi:uncharacterized protein